MKNLKIFCITLNPLHKDLINKLGYTPVGLGENSFQGEWLNDKTKKNIAEKNRYYGEYTFHYWLWKNNALDFNDWVGFCQYRKFWKKDFSTFNIENFEILNNSVLKEIPSDLNKYNSIIGENLFVNQLRFSKFVKHNLKTIIREPSLLFNKNKRTIKFHFDMMHGNGNLDKAIQILNTKDRNDFNDFVNTEVSFNPHNMFICKNKDILYSYYESLFPWLHECEKIFGFKDLKGFGLQRIYGFLAERYMSYWFKKYTRHVTLPILFKDISDFL
ncbi:MAG: DUF4422 domain-containing protein [Pelagibacteraceae bacterium]|jgi:hypothetical protein|nr:DUF4422 domain-containing protein [Pelagibacteraceae bacterium]